MAPFPPNEVSRVLRCALLPVFLLSLSVAPASAGESEVTSRAYQARVILNEAEDSLDKIEFMLDDLQRFIRKSAHMARFQDMGIPKALESVDQRVADLPKSWPRLKETRKRIDGLKRRLERLRSEAKPALDAYLQATHMSQFPRYEADLEITTAVARMYDLPAEAFLEPLDVQDHVAQLHTIVGYINGSAETYAPLINLKAPEGEAMNQAQEEAAQALRLFVEQWRTFGKRGPDRAYDNIRRSFRAIRKAEVTGDMKQLMRARDQLRSAGEVLHVLRQARGPDQDLLKPVDKSYRQAREALARVEEAVTDDLTASTRAPEDAFKGDDRGELESATRVAWAQRDLSAEVLSVRIHDEDWRRFSGVRWTPRSGDWERFDLLRLRATVIVRKDNARATLHDVTIQRHPDSKRLTGKTAPVTEPREMFTANL